MDWHATDQHDQHVRDFLDELYCGILVYQPAHHGVNLTYQIMHSVAITQPQGVDLQTLVEQFPAKQRQSEVILEVKNLEARGMLSIKENGLFYIPGWDEWWQDWTRRTDEEWSDIVAGVRMAEAEDPSVADLELLKPRRTTRKPTRH